MRESGRDSVGGGSDGGVRAVSVVSSSGGSVESWSAPNGSAGRGWFETRQRASREG
jgi:hypothetical protein